MNKKNLVVGLAVSSLLFGSQALAHTTVKPATVGIGKFQTFTVAAPSEKPIATVGIRLVLPEGLNHVSPNVKPGWKVEVKKAIIGNEEKAVEINWTGGSIPAEMRDEFLFSAQVPSQPTLLAWKAYQTYADGSVVAWDQDPNAPKADDHDFSTTGPYSKTEVVEDLLPTLPGDQTRPSNNTAANTALVLGAGAFVVALVALKKATK